MKRAGYENIDFFIGTEVEHTPAFGEYTLFVIGVQPLDKIKRYLTYGQETVNHIYFGANQSFPLHDIQAEDWQPWVTMIEEFLKLGLLCTLDVDVYNIEYLTQTVLPSYNNFIPMISVKLPYIQLLGYNATIKLDDKDFAATNPGVWCHSVHELRDRKVFTDWSKYTKDEVVK